MQTIMKKLNELVSICETRVKKVDADRDVLSSKSAVLEAKEKELNKKANSVAEDISSLNELKIKHEDLVAAKALKKELEAEIKRYKDLQSELKEKFEEAEKLKKDGLSEVADKKAKLQAEIEQIEKKKNEFKADVMKSISAELKKKGIEL